MKKLLLMALMFGCGSVMADDQVPAEVPAEEVVPAPTEEAPAPEQL